MEHKTIEIKKLSPEETNSIFLIGYMGTGKTSTAYCLSELLRVPFIDLDEAIEVFSEKTVSEIFEKEGEEEFRVLETLVLLTTIDNISKNKIPPINDTYFTDKGAIVSCGGGTALSPINIAAMRNTGSIVLLTAKPETIFDRISGDQSRPLIVGQDLESIKEMMELREPIYLDAAHYIIDTEEKNPAEVAGEIVVALGLVPFVS